ncbi:hypothetical protein ABH968_004871 [Lysinibacillus sp. RC79]
MNRQDTLVEAEVLAFLDSGSTPVVSIHKVDTNVVISTI